VSGPGSPLTLRAELMTPGNIGPPGLWKAVDIDGNTIVACDHSWGESPDSAGVCDVFQRSAGWGGHWVFAQRLLASNPAPWMTFGYDVAIDGDTILVGAPYWKDSLHRDQAGVFVFERMESGYWEETQQIGRIDGIAFDHVGRSVALEGDLAVLGVPMGGDPRTSGAAMVYRRNSDRGGEWELIAILNDTAPENGLEFGWSVATNGREILVGAPYDRDRGYEAGAATVFVRQLSRDPGSRRRP
jgi:hypothetical protein